MASTKLSAEDKQAIVKLYQEVGQTAATVAKQYGVSVSTISRLLKSELPTETYEALVKQKRGGGETKSKKRTSRKKSVSKLKKEAAPPAEEKESIEPETPPETPPEAGGESDDEPEAAPTPTRRRRTRSSSTKKRPVSRRKSKDSEETAAVEATAKEIADADAPATEIVEVEAASQPTDTDTGRKKPVKRTRPRLKKAAEVEEIAAESGEAIVEAMEAEESESQPRRRTRRRTRPRATAVVVEAPPEEEVAEEEETALVATSDETDGLALEDVTETLSNGEEDFDDAFDDDEELEEEDDSSDNITSLRRRSSNVDVVQIQPLSEANLSRMLYLVIDRTADLITMPMVFFSDLGELPEEEERKKTLPVFENHRVARRFSQRNQRVIKVPDGELISKTASWLEAKGITRCLLDGQVYSLESEEQ